MNDFNSNELYAEQALLGSLLKDNSTWDEIGDLLQPGDFILRLHGDVYQAIQDLLSNGKNADIICVEQYLKAKTYGEEVFVQLCHILKSQFTSENIKYYADFVKEKSRDRQMIAAAQEVITSVRAQKENRLDYAQQLFSSIAEQVPCRTESLSEILKKVLISVDERQSHPGETVGLSTGFLDLDKITYGLNEGELIILAGRPSMGKTLLAMNIAENVAVYKKMPVVIFSLEMRSEELVERSLASVAKIESNSMKTGTLNELDFQKISSSLIHFQDAKLFIHDKACLNVLEMRAKCRRVKRESGLSLVIVDYITLMSGGVGENETSRITNISRGLKLLARDLNVPVIAISQLNRSLEQRQDKRPLMSDLRQSGAIEQDADLILFIYRDEVYNQNSGYKGIAELIIAKHRKGRTGTINLSFNSKYCRFDNYSGDSSNWGEGKKPSPQQSKRQQFEY